MGGALPAARRGGCVKSARQFRIADMQGLLEPLHGVHEAREAPLKAAYGPGRRAGVLAWREILRQGCGMAFVRDAGQAESGFANKAARK